LSLAVAEINRYSSVEVSIERPEAKQILVNGLFQAGDSRSFAEAVALTYGLRVVSQEGRLVLSGIPHH
jgi:ferric-dicitrate binding protein FerR (iron transport regulator)